MYTHIFPDTTSRTIIIEGQNITHLRCSYIQLTLLDVSNNTALTYLDFSDNKVTTEDINAIFGTLHSNEVEKDIYIGGNSGADDCDRSIATNKGWSVQNYGA